MNNKKQRYLFTDLDKIEFTRSTNEEYVTRKKVYFTNIRTILIFQGVDISKPIIQSNKKISFSDKKCRKKIHYYF